jgi:hypothetical protein
MIFKIGKPKKNKKQGFYIKIEFMHGDADGTTYDEVGPFYEKDFPLATEFIEFLESAIHGSYEAQRHEKEGESEYPKYWQRFMDEDWPEDLEEYDCPFYLELPGDHTCDYQYRANMQGWKAFYIDENGKKFEVTTSDN